MTPYVDDVLERTIAAFCKKGRTAVLTPEEGSALWKACRANGYRCVGIKAGEKRPAEKAWNAKDHPIWTPALPGIGIVAGGLHPTERDKEGWPLRIPVVGGALHLDIDLHWERAPGLDRTKLFEAVRDLPSVFRLHKAGALLRYRGDAMDGFTLSARNDGSILNQLPRWYAEGVDKAVAGLDVLAAGFQSVGYAIHPSGVPYLWRGNRSPATVPLAELPMIGFDDLARLIEELNGAFRAFGLGDKPPKARASNVSDELRSRRAPVSVSDELRDALHEVAKHYFVNSSQRRNIWRNYARVMNQLGDDPDAAITRWREVYHPSEKPQRSLEKSEAEAISQMEKPPGVRDAVDVGGAIRAFEDWLPEKHPKRDEWRKTLEDVKAAARATAAPLSAEDAARWEEAIASARGMDSGDRGEAAGEAAGDVEPIRRVGGLTLYPNGADMPGIDDQSIAGYVLPALAKHSGATVNQLKFTEGKFWAYSAAAGIWRELTETAVRNMVMRANGLKRTDKQVLGLTARKIDSICRLMADALSDVDFFASEREGVVVLQDKTLRMAENGTLIFEEHDPNNRCRFSLDVRSEDIGRQSLDGSLLARLIKGCFENDAVKAQAMQELLARPVFGILPARPLAAILKGATAMNGKSQWIELAVMMLPERATCVLNPSELDKEFSRAPLAGRRLLYNAELPDRRFPSGYLKALITGDAIDAREPHGRAFSFRNRGLILLASNHRLEAKGGSIDNGVLSRLAYLEFERTIPASERIANIGERIAREELTLLVQWVAEGASRLMQNKGEFSPDVLAALKLAASQNVEAVDPIRAFANECLVPVETASTSTRDAYSAFKHYLETEGVPRPFHAARTDRWPQARVAGGENRKDQREGGAYNSRICVRKHAGRGD